MMVESQGKTDTEHESGQTTNKKLTDLINNLGNGEEVGEENVIEEED